MAIDSKNPGYALRVEDWIQLRDCYDGERAVKDADTKYLPATQGQEHDGMSANAPGRRNYDAYKARSVYRNFVRDAVEDLVGIMHRKPPAIEVPARLEPMLEHGTVDGEPLALLLRRINQAQLLYGRFGLLLEAPDGANAADALPFIAPYSALRIINWDSGARRTGGMRELEIVVLEETELSRGESFEFVQVRQFRVLAAGGQTQFLQADEAAQARRGAAGQYAVAVVRGEGASEPTAADFIVPQIAGRALDRIPFTFVNVSDLLPEVDQPPLLGLSNLSLAVYRGEADLRQALFAQGQETLVVIGRSQPDADEETRTGAGAVLDLPMGGDAKYVGVEAKGLTTLKETIQADRDEAAHHGGRLLMAVEGGEAASGKALGIRVAASTASLVQIARAGAEALATQLRTAAEWIGADPAEVRVEPNTDFAADTMTGRELLELMQARTMGAPLSLRTVHRIMQTRDLTEMDFDEEMEEVAEDDATVAARREAGGVVDGGPQPGGDTVEGGNGDDTAEGEDA